jgi:hypothetical protein
MPRSLFGSLAACALACLGLFGCNEEDPPALYLDLDYQLRCNDCEPRGNDGPVRDVQAVDGEGGNNLTCYYESNLLTLELEGSGFTFRILQARLGDDPGEFCEIVVSEGSGSQYRGDCRGPDDDSSGAPCELEITNEGGVLSGTLLCTNIRHELTPEYERYVVAPMSDDPVEFTVQGCSGL